jgi:hypothetical protein
MRVQRTLNALYILVAIVSAASALQIKQLDEEERDDAVPVTVRPTGAAAKTCVELDMPPRFQWDQYGGELVI